MYECEITDDSSVHQHASTVQQMNYTPEGLTSEILQAGDGRAQQREQSGLQEGV